LRRRARKQAIDGDDSGEIGLHPCDAHTEINSKRHSNTNQK
jgi:hypothetical protein